MFESLATYGPLAAIAAFWQQFRSFLSRIVSYVVVSAQVEQKLGDMIVAYCREYHKVSRFGSKKYWLMTSYVRPVDDIIQVPIETPSNLMTLYVSWWQLLFLRTASNNSSGNETTITYLRGTINFEQFLIKVVGWYNNRSKLSNGNRRYQVHKLFGRAIYQGGDSDLTDTSPPTIRESGKEHVDDNKLLLRPLGWQREDLYPKLQPLPFNGLEYSSGITDLRTTIERWQKSKTWYQAKNLDWRFGICLYGRPGTGKTSFVRAIAQVIDYPVYVFDLNTMTNQDLVEYWRKTSSEAPCIILFEDIDRLFNDKHEFTAKRLTLDCLLNCISGVEPSNGILTIVTANDVSRIDAALGIDIGGRSTRPGRIDYIVEFKSLTHDQRLAIAQRVLSDFENGEILDVVNEGQDETGAQFSKRCELLAITRYWEMQNVV